MRRSILLFALAAVFFPALCTAAPDTMAVRVTDVTPNSACLVWLTDTSAEPAVEVYSDQSMTNNITGQFKAVPMPGASAEVAEAAKAKGVLKVSVQGLEAGTRYYMRAVTADRDDPASRSYSPLQQVTTPNEAASYTHVNGQPVAYSNDLESFPVYIIPGTAEQKPGLGDVILLEPFEPSGTAYPVTAFVGEGISSPDGVIDLNNLFGKDGVSLPLSETEKEKTVLTVYRGGKLPSLVHYRWLQENSGKNEVREATKGFFADFNLDGKIDMADFQEFKKYYRTIKTDDAYNPDFDFVDDSEGVVDAREFSKFAEQYGMTVVQ